MNKPTVILASLLVPLLCISACDTPTPQLRGGQDVPPDVPITDRFQICILKAELCAARAYQPTCGHLDDVEMQDCIEVYEDCTSGSNLPKPDPIEEAFIPTCRGAHAWCALEIPASIEMGINPEEVMACAEIDAACPSWP